MNSNKLPRFDYDEADLVERIKNALDAPGGCIVNKMPCSEDNAELEALATALGEPMREPHNLGGGMVCEVAVEASESRPYANTPWHFPAHTDCSDHAYPPETVLLLCQQPALSGGDSFVVLLEDALEQLDLMDMMALQEGQFYFRFGHLPILGQADGRIVVRYSRQMLEMFKPDDRPAELAELLDRFDKALEAVSFSFPLHKGDCLILNNHRTLHGRTEFVDDGSRLMKRVRVRSRPLNSERSSP